MKAYSQRPDGQKDTMSALNAAIDAMDLAREVSGIVPANAVFGTVGVLLAMIRDSMVNRSDYVELGLSCADICRVLDRRTNGKKMDELSRTVYDAIDQLTLTVAGIQRKLVKWDGRNAVSRRLHAKNEKGKITTWRLDLDKILQVFNKELATNTDVIDPAIRHNVVDTHTTTSSVRNDVVNTPSLVSDSHHNASKGLGDARGKDRMANITRALLATEQSHASAPGESPPPLLGSTYGTVSDIRHDVLKSRAMISELEHNVTSTHTMVSDMHHTMMKGQERSGGKNPSTQISTLGEPLPAVPRACFGRRELIEEIVGLAENLTPTALIGVGGIGKTSIALTVLHHDRIKQRFGDHRRFIRCDKFPASCAHFLGRLSKVIGAGVENPENLAALHPFLTSNEVLIVLDNVESILDPQGTDAQEIYAVVEELSRFNNIWLCITSRISAIPSDFEILDIPALSTEAARDAFYGIYKNREESSLVDTILGQLDFHPLSITLLATVARQNRWDTDQLTREWERRRTRVLQTEHNKSLAVTIELSLTSPTFQELGPDARALLGVIAFFPQGVDENNIDWLFPTISDKINIFDKFCILSLTYRSNGFVAMLAPLRDYLSPKDPKLSPLLCATKDHYFTRMSVDRDPGEPDYGGTQWIISEDVNVEHLLDVFTTIDADSDNAWDACADFVAHIRWHKQRPTILRPKIEGLPDDHRSKPECLFELSRLFESVGNDVERKLVLTHTLKLWRERKNDRRVARTLIELSDTNRLTDLRGEGIQLAEEALKIFERLGDAVEQARCWINLALSLYQDKQLDAAEEATSRAIDLLPEKGEQLHVCESHHILGDIYRSKRKTKKAIHHYEAALGIASSFNWHDQLFWIRYSLAALSRDRGRSEDAHVHIEQAKLHAGNNAYNLARAMELQARVWRRQHRLEEAMSEALRAADVFEKFGAANDAEDCKKLLQRIQEELNALVASGQSVFNSQGTV